MKKLLIILFYFFIQNHAFTQSEGLKSLNKKCNEAEKHLENKYNAKITSHYCDISVKHGFALESVVSFDETPTCYSKTITFFDEKYKNILEVRDQMEADKFAFLRTQKAINTFKPILASFDSFGLEYSSFDIAIFLKGSMNSSNLETLKLFFETLKKPENKSIFINKNAQNEETIIPKLYISIIENEIDTSAIPLMEIEKNTLPISVFKIEKKWNVNAKTFAEYCVYTDTQDALNGISIQHQLQRKLNAVNPQNKAYLISEGGFNYINQ